MSLYWLCFIVICEYDAAFTQLTVQRSAAYEVSLSIGGCSWVPLRTTTDKYTFSLYFHLYDIFDAVA